MTKVNFPEEKFMKKQQVRNEQTYYREMYEYIQQEKETLRTECDTTNDVPIKEEMVSEMKTLNELFK